jgi:hypothetical protein
MIQKHLPNNNSVPDVQPRSHAEIIWLKWAYPSGSKLLVASRVTTLIVELMSMTIEQPESRSAVIP